MSISTLYEPGDYICPTYTPNGTATSKAKINGDPEQIQERVDRMKANALRSGAEIHKIEAVVKKASRAKAKVNITKVVTPAVPVVSAEAYLMPLVEPMVETAQKINVTFTFPHGEFVLWAQDVYTEINSMMLVFRSEDDLKFTPKAGAEFTMTYSDNPQPIPVMYPGFRFKDKAGRVYLIMALL